MRKVIRSIGILCIIIGLVSFSVPAIAVNAGVTSDFVKNGSVLVAYNGNEKVVSIPNGIETIAKDAFLNNTTMEKVVFPASVTRIEPFAFWGCSNLKEISFGKGLKRIDDYAFANAYGLQNLEIPETISEIGIYAFEDCHYLTDITIPYTVLSIHETAFEGCCRLVIHCDSGTYADRYREDFYIRQKDMCEYEDWDFLLPDSTDPVPGTDQANDEQEDVTIPDDTVEDTRDTLMGQVSVVQNTAVVFIDNSSFPVYMKENPTEEEFPEENRYPLLESERLKGKIPKYSIAYEHIVADGAYYRNSLLDKISIPDTITEIGEFAFARSSLKEIQFGTNVETVSYGAFYHCNDLSKVTLSEQTMVVEPKAFEYTPWVENFRSGTDDSTGDFLISAGVLVAYRGDTSAVDIPRGVRTIAAQCFKDHLEIQSLRLPSSLLCVGEEAFMGCENLTSVFWGSNELYVKDRAFRDTGIEAIKLPDSIREIGYQAFPGETRITGNEAYSLSVENTTRRLSNKELRDTVEEKEGSVEVVGRPGSRASLAGATSAYVLSIEEGDGVSFEPAFQTALNSSLPKDAILYSLSLSDTSGVSITKLGKQTLSICLPIPEKWESARLRGVILDRNGQLEEVKVQKCEENNQYYALVELQFVSQLCLYSNGTLEEEAMSLTTVFEQLSPPKMPKKEENLTWLRRNYGAIAIIFVSLGSALVLGSWLVKK